LVTGKTHHGTGDMAQAVEHLPPKCKALNSNPNTGKKKKKRRKKEKKRKLQHCTWLLAFCDSQLSLLRIWLILNQIYYHESTKELNQIKFSFFPHYWGLNSGPHVC
jgi:hypothetical protein